MKRNSQARTERSLGTRLAIFCTAGVLACALDQITKTWVRNSIPVGTSTSFIPGIMELFHVNNTGAAFSLGSGNALLFVGLTVVVIIALIVLVVSEKKFPPVLIALLGGVAGGGIGNAIDRVLFGHVTDFFATTFMNFAVFNVADIFVTCGIFLAFLYWIIWDKKQQQGSDNE
ncbi:MAG: signal peptidase II [Atopobiaceae bacterium]|nr:signal peptidase II [Atopobiaceae bacterium]